MIRPCTDTDFDTICAIVNDTAMALQGCHSGRPLA